MSVRVPADVYVPGDEPVRITARGYARLARVEPDPLVAARWRLLATLKMVCARRRIVSTRERQFEWELRTYWARGREVIAVLDPEWAGQPRVRGYVVWVAPSGAAVRIDDGGVSVSLDGREVVGLHVPLAAVLNVRRPHFLEDGDAARPDRGAPARLEALPGQLDLFEDYADQLTLRVT